MSRVHWMGGAVYLDTPNLLIGAPAGIASGCPNAVAGVLLWSGDLEHCAGLVELLAARPGLPVGVPLFDDRGARLAEVVVQVWGSEHPIDALAPDATFAFGAFDARVFAIDASGRPGLGVAIDGLVVLPPCTLSGEVRRAVRRAETLVLPGWHHVPHELLSWAPTASFILPPGATA